MRNKSHLLLFCLLFWGVRMIAQTQPADTGFVYIDTIKLMGNRKTKASLILRELEFKIGDSIAQRDLYTVLERNSLRLLNLNLFTIANIHVIQLEPGNHVTLQIDMTETWYILPVPLLNFIDRNFNVWWKEFHGSLRRLNYGVDLSHNNLSGYADVLKAKFEAGYNNRYEIAYRFPPLNRSQTLTLQSAVSYSRQHEVAYITSEDKVRFRKDPNRWNITQVNAYISLSWRPALNTSQAFSLEYRDSRASDSIAQILNPNFFLNSQTRQQHFSFVYTLTWDRRDIRPYPLHGFFFRTEVRQNGLLPSDDLHLFRVFAEHTRYFPVVPMLYADVALKGRFSLPRKKPPYFNNQALGYGGNFVRGYEYYVADGLDFAVLKTAFHFEFLNRVFHFGKYMPFKAFREFPLKLYLSFNNDTGFSNDPYYQSGNTLNNRLLYGYGIGFDVVALYNKTARFEYSRNDLGQQGFFLRIDSGF
jgi:outer membrane protein assembly factor BamA